MLFNILCRVSSDLHFNVCVKFDFDDISLYTYKKRLRKDIVRLSDYITKYISCLLTLNKCIILL